MGLSLGFGSNLNVHQERNGKRRCGTVYNGMLLSCRRKEIGLFVETWMDVETVIRSEVSQRNRNASY